MGWDKQIERDRCHRQYGDNLLKSPLPYDYDKVIAGFNKTHNSTSEGVPFKLKMPRDNLFEKLHGLPKESKK
jgi:hypothetical protein